MDYAYGYGYPGEYGYDYGGLGGNGTYPTNPYDIPGSLNGSGGYTPSIGPYDFAPPGFCSGYDYPGGGYEYVPPDIYPGIG